MAKGRSWLFPILALSIAVIMLVSISPMFSNEVAPRLGLADSFKLPGSKPSALGQRQGSNRNEHLGHVLQRGPTGDASTGGRAGGDGWMRRDSGGDATLRQSSNGDGTTRLDEGGRADGRTKDDARDERLRGPGERRGSSEGTMTYGSTEVDQRQPRERWSRIKWNNTQCQLWPLDLNKLKPFLTNNASCFDRALKGENVLLERILDFADEWDAKHLSPGHPPFLCDIICRPERFIESPEWFKHDADEGVYVFKRDDVFDWKQIKPPANGKAVMIVFASTGSHCNLYDLENFQKSGNFKVVIVGPWGDKENFGPFSGGVHSHYFHFSVEKSFTKYICPNRVFADVIALLESHRVLGMITMQQNIDHPKLISLPLGISLGFSYFGLQKDAIAKSLTTKKSWLMAVTFNIGSMWGNRSDYLHAINASAVLRDKARYSAVNPNSGKSTLGVRKKWELALVPSRESKIMPSPGGYGIDTKRPFEGMLAGCMPYTLRQTGLYKSFRNLPIIFKDSLHDDQAVEFEYASLACRERPWLFDKLTFLGWREFLDRLRSGQNTIDDW